MLRILPIDILIWVTDAVKAGSSFFSVDEWVLSLFLIFISRSDPESHSLIILVVF